MISRILGGSEAGALETLAAIEEKILHLKPINEYGVKVEDISIFPNSVLANQQRLVTNSYVPLNRELIEEIYIETYKLDSLN